MGIAQLAWILMHRTHKNNYSNVIKKYNRHKMVHTRKFQGNLAAICDDLRAVEAASGHKIVQLTSRKTDSKLKPRHQQKCLTTQYPIEK